jgi:hypothetical protein
MNTKNMCGKGQGDRGYTRARKSIVLRRLTHLPDRISKEKTLTSRIMGEKTGKHDRVLPTKISHLIELVGKRSA